MDGRKSPLKAVSTRARVVALCASRTGDVPNLSEGLPVAAAEQRSMM